MDLLAERQEDMTTIVWHSTSMFVPWNDVCRTSVRQSVLSQIGYRLMRRGLEPKGHAVWRHLPQCCDMWECVVEYSVEEKEDGTQS
jgi:hypothetical protein